MFNRRFSSTIRVRKRMITSTIILLVVCLGLGYSAFTTNLSISGTLNVSKYDHTLYGVLEKNLNKNNAVIEYTGSHHDSFTEEPSKSIYTLHSSFLNNNISIGTNVLFADHCWKMIRTTDTGGVKLLYNGEAENNQCLSSRGNHVGYNSKTTVTLQTTYYYGTSYTYDTTNNVFNLSGTVTTGSVKLGEYTCRSSSSTGTCSTLYLVRNNSESNIYNVFTLTNNSHYSQYGKLPFSDMASSLGRTGYMGKGNYPSGNEHISMDETIYSSGTLRTTYWYGNNYDYGNVVANKYSLTDPFQVSSSSDYPNLVGTYTFGNTNQTYSNSTINYIVAVNSSTYYYIQLSGNNNITYYNDSYTYGDGYTDNGNGTFTINNPTTISRTDYYNQRDNLMNKYVCKNATSNTCNSVWYVIDVRSTSFSYETSDRTYKYAKGFTYSNGTYTLNNQSVTFFDYNAQPSGVLANAHYTCFNLSGQCSEIAYIYEERSGTDTTTFYYTTLTNGKDISTAINEMLYNNDVNQIDSSIKSGIDAWYKKYMTSYTNKLEDTIFCCDRSISNLGGWDPNGGSVYTGLSHTISNELSCANTVDKFSTNNSLAQLVYPVGLATTAEMKLLNSNVYLNTGQTYWLITPTGKSANYTHNGYISNDGSSTGGYASSSSNGVRPVISLKPGTEYVSGTGSMANPYVVQ